MLWQCVRIPGSGTLTLCCVVLDYLRASEASPTSSVQFELRLVAERGDRRLGLLVRPKNAYLADEAQMLGIMMRGQSVTVDDLRDPSSGGLITRSLIWMLGLRVPRPQRAAWLPVFKGALAVLIVAETMFTAVLTVATFLSCTPTHCGGFQGTSDAVSVILLVAPPCAALAFWTAPLVAAVDLVFPEMKVTRGSVMWNLFSVFGVVVFSMFLLGNSYIYSGDYNSIAKYARDRWAHVGHIMWKMGPPKFVSYGSETNVTLTVCIALILVKLARSIVSNFCAAAWLSADQAEETAAPRNNHRSSDRCATILPSIARI
eukprot:COSAG05_NODE_1266_length_5332_cov_5.080833_3_plen_316_part_00